MVSRWRARKWIGYAVALAGCGMALLIRLALGRLLVGAPFITFIPVILLATLAGGLVTGALAILISAILADDFLIAPTGLSLLWPSGWVVIGAFVIITGIMVVLIDFAISTAARLAESTRLLRIANDTLEERIAARTAELMQAEAQLRQSQKMEAVGQLTGGLAHDFNNLLTAISGSLELLATRLVQGRTGDLGRYILEAQAAAKRAAGLTHRLLAFSRRQTLDPKPTDINRLVTGMEDLIRRTVGPGITVEVVRGAGLWTALVDPNQLEHGLLNLCINGSDAMPAGGRLVIETANRAMDDAAARVPDLAAGDYVCLSVKDNGTGMPADVVARAFDPFFTTKPIGQGTGLGLSMLYGFVRQSGGQVRISSEIGQGSEVCIYLPRHRGQVALPETAGAIAAVARANDGQTVLVVDDEPTVRMVVTEVLEDLGYQALQAADGPAGMDILRGNGRVDLLITDVGLPGMNGRQLADAARGLRPGLKVLFITGYAETALTSHGQLEPGMQVLTKPFALDHLAVRIQDMITA